MSPLVKAEFIRQNPNATPPGSISQVEYKLDGHTAWLCFGPRNVAWPTDHTGSNDWLTYQHTEGLPAIATKGGPKNWSAQHYGYVPEWGYGRERLNLTTSGKWGINDPETFEEDTLRDVKPYGAQQLVVVAKEEVDVKAKLVEDYQLKVLYEYGNCQYNFSRNGAPTRVLPNVVPVGPSPGLPSL